MCQVRNKKDIPDSEGVTQQTRVSEADRGEGPAQWSSGLRKWGAGREQGKTKN